MPEDWHKIATGVRYRGLDVTLLGNDSAGLLAIAGYGTRDELAIGAITIAHRAGRPIYRPVGAHSCTTSTKVAAEALVRARQARDERER